MKRTRMLIVLFAAIALVSCTSVATPEPTGVSVALPIVEVEGDSPLVPPVPDGELAPGGREASFPNTIIVYQLDDGNGPSQWTFYDTGRIVGGDGAEWQVPAEAVAPLFGAVGAAGFAGLDASYAPDGECAGCSVHTLTIYHGEEVQEIVVVQGAPEVPVLLSLALETITVLVSE